MAEGRPPGCPQHARTTPAGRRGGPARPQKATAFGAQGGGVDRRDPRGGRVVVVVVVTAAPATAVAAVVAAAAAAVVAVVVTAARADGIVADHRPRLDAAARHRRHLHARQPCGVGRENNTGRQPAGRAKGRAPHLGVLGKEDVGPDHNVVAQDRAREDDDAALDDRVVPDHHLVQHAVVLNHDIVPDVRVADLDAGANDAVAANGAVRHDGRRRAFPPDARAVADHHVLLQEAATEESTDEQVRTKPGAATQRRGGPAPRQEDVVLQVDVGALVLAEAAARRENVRHQRVRPAVQNVLSAGRMGQGAPVARQGRRTTPRRT